MSDFNMGGLEFRRATLAERDEIERASRASGGSMTSMPYFWRRAQGWEKSPPFVVMSPVGRVVGFHAAMFGKTHMNSYYLWVDADARGLGLAGRLIDESLAEAKARECSRLKFKCALKSPGRLFWEGFGARPWARKGDELCYDGSLANVDEARDLLLTTRADWSPDEDTRRRSWRGPFDEVLL